MLEAHKDEDATKARHFLDKRSHVTIGGKTFLFGRDVEPLRRECYQRSLGWCEMHLYVNGSSKAITWEGFVMHHEPPYSKGGWDHLEGVLAICQGCDEWRHRGAGRNRANRECTGRSLLAFIGSALLLGLLALGLIAGWARKAGVW